MTALITTIEWAPRSQRTPLEVVQPFCGLLRDELAWRTAQGLEAVSLRHYYRRLFLPDGGLDPLGVYGYASRLGPLLEVVYAAARPPTVLDCGCGYGTESLLLALSGVEVTAVDVEPRRLELARTRLPFYAQRARRPLNVRFLNANVSRHLEAAAPVDVIWGLEAISHIHPLEDFLALAFEKLVPGGCLVTSDPNALNPLAQYRAYRIRGTHHFRTRVKGLDPAHGTPVVEAVERIFAVGAYIQTLRQAGFAIARVQLSGFMAASLIPSRWHRSRAVYALATAAQSALQAFPVVRQLGMNFTVVARKTGAGPVRSASGPCAS